MKNIDWDELRRAAREIEQNSKANEHKPDENPDDTDIFFKVPDGTKVVLEREDRVSCDDNLYAFRKRMLPYVRELSAISNYDTHEVQALYKTLFDFLNDDYVRLRDAIYEDLKELDACFSAKAYKATLIMAGSILEAFLLDWLSENDGKDYFHEPYRIRVIKDDGTVRWEKKEQLSVYIDQINEIERPDWMESSEKAHYIRERRNTVHAKVCLREEEKIDEETLYQGHYIFEGDH